MHINQSSLTPFGAHMHTRESRNSEVNAPKSFVIWESRVMELFAVALLCVLQVVTDETLKFQVKYNTFTVGNRSKGHWNHRKPHRLFQLSQISLAGRQTV